MFIKNDIGLGRSFYVVQVVITGEINKLACHIGGHAMNGFKFMFKGVVDCSRFGTIGGSSGRS